jgi:DNA-binding NarL/FixJ family response regulator
MPGLRILIADDHEAVRKGIRSLLMGHDGWEVLAEAVDGSDAIGKASELRPDMVLLDVGMPNLNGFQVARRILKSSPETKVLMVTVNADKHTAQEAKHVGARGFISKVDVVRDLIHAVEAIQNGELFFPLLKAES